MYYRKFYLDEQAPGRRPSLRSRSPFLRAHGSFQRKKFGHVLRIIFFVRKAPHAQLVRQPKYPLILSLTRQMSSHGLARESQWKRKFFGAPSTFFSLTNTKLNVSSVLQISWVYKVGVRVRWNIHSFPLFPFLLWYFRNNVSPLSHYITRLQCSHDTFQRPLVNKLDWLSRWRMVGWEIRRISEPRLNSLLTHR